MYGTIKNNKQNKFFCWHLEHHWQKRLDPEQDLDRIRKSEVRIRGSGSVSQRNGSADLNPYQNVADPQHCFQAKDRVEKLLPYFSWVASLDLWAAKWAENSLLESSCSQLSKGQGMFLNKTKICTNISWTDEQGRLLTFIRDSFAITYEKLEITTS